MDYFRHRPDKKSTRKLYNYSNLMRRFEAIQSVGLNDRKKIVPKILNLIGISITCLVHLVFFIK